MISNHPIVKQGEHHYLGLAPLLKLSVNGHDLRPIAQSFLEAAASQENNAVLWLNLATAFFTIGQREMGLTIQQEALASQLDYPLLANQRPAQHQLLVLMAAGDLAENCPIDCLLAEGNTDLFFHFSTLEAPLPNNIPAHDALFVAISDTEKSRPLLEALIPLLENWPHPVINQPARITQVERATASELLQGIHGLAMPLTLATTRTELLTLEPDDLPYPIILRPVGSHAGVDLEKLDNHTDLLGYLDKVGAQTFYLSSFIDYRSQDGQYRKYRLAMVNGQVFPAHMAISDHWIVHYLNAGMYDDHAKQEEEAHFMASFHTFATRHQSALQALHQRVGLDYLCIDCAETIHGDLLIFEIDHAMVVHSLDAEDRFDYKISPIQQIRTAFEQLIGKKI